MHNTSIRMSGASLFKLDRLAREPMSICLQGKPKPPAFLTNGPWASHHRSRNGGVWEIVYENYGRRHTASDSVITDERW